MLSVPVLPLLVPARSVLAQAAGADSLLGGQFGVLLPIVIMFAIFYFLLIRPQQRRVKEHQALVQAVRRGDTVVTAGGIVGRVTRSVDGEAEVDVEIADNVKVKVVRSTITDVRTKGEPVRDKA